jgi:site-specific DNA recombinase
MATKGKPLRFAALIRVSTKEQAQFGESLRTQKADIEADVKSLGGKVVEWYGGQEHATPGHSTTEVDRLLADAAKHKFDAMIVAHQDRWSRDNLKSKIGLEVLRQNNVRFFVRTQEWDLFNPTHKFFLGVSAEIGEFIAGTQNEKSIENRIARAKRGIPTAGKKPYGRIWNKQTEKWSLDPVKHATIKDVAKRYLNGEQAPLLAKEIGMNYSNLMKLLRGRCGDTWTETFDYPAFQIHEVVTHKIPRLLPEKTIQAIHKKAKFNRTFFDSKRHYDYLLSSYIFCSHCDYLMIGQTNHANSSHKKKSYYRHPRHLVKPCTVTPAYVDAQVIERQVLFMLFNLFGNPVAVEKAIKAAIPNQKEVVALQQQQAQLAEAIAKTQSQRQRLIDLVTEAKISEVESDRKFVQLREKEEQQQQQFDKIESQVGNVLSETTIRTLSDDVVTKLRAALFPSQRGKRKLPTMPAKLELTLDALDHPEDIDAAIDAMSWEEKRGLIETVFAGETGDKKPAGVYIEFVPARNKNCRPTWKFEIRGVISPKGMAKLVGNDGRSQNAFVWRRPSRPGSSWSVWFGSVRPSC